MKQSAFDFWFAVLSSPKVQKIFRDSYHGDIHLMAAALCAVQFSAGCRGECVTTPIELIQYAVRSNDPVGRYLAIERDEEAAFLKLHRLPGIEAESGDLFGQELLECVWDNRWKPTVPYPKAQEVILSLMTASSGRRKIKSAIFYGTDSASLAFTAASHEIHSRLVTPDIKWGELFVATFSRFVDNFLLSLDESQTSSERADAFFIMAGAPAIFIPPELKRLIFREVEGSIFFLSPKNGMGFFRSEKERRDFIEEFGLSRVVDFGGNIIRGYSCPFYLLECAGVGPKDEIDFLYFPKLPRLTRRNTDSALSTWADSCLSFLHGKSNDTGAEEVLVPLAEVKGNKWKILPPLYHVSAEKKALDRFVSGTQEGRLDSEFDIIRCQPLSRAISEFSAAKEADLKKIYEIKLSNIGSAGEIQVSEDCALNLPAGLLLGTRLKEQILRPGDVLLGVLGSVGKLAVVTEIPRHSYWVASQAFAVIRSRKPHIGDLPFSLGLYLFLYLHSEIVGKYLLSSVFEDGGSRSLSLDVLKKLPYVLPTAKDLIRAEMTYRRVVDLGNQIKEMQEELEKLLNDDLADRIAEGKSQSGKGKR